MKRKSIALLLALMMCLALLSACGGNSTTETSEPPSSENTAQPTADGKEGQPTQEPGQGEPTETEPAETEQPTETEPTETEPTVTPEPAPTEETSGTFTYTYEGGVVTISGTGILDYTAMYVCGAMDVINSTADVQVVLEPGVTEIGENAFHSCVNADLKL